LFNVIIFSPFSKFVNREFGSCFYIYIKIFGIYKNIDKLTNFLFLKTSTLLKHRNGKEIHFQGLKLYEDFGK